MTLISKIPNFYSESTRLAIVDFLDNELGVTWDCNKTSDSDVDSVQNGRTTYTELPFFNDEHSRLTDLVSAVFKEQLRPTYTCLSCYDRGESSLRLHIDRDQCYRTITYMIRCDDVSDWILNVGQWELTDQERDEVLHNTHELWKEHPKSDEEKKAVLDSQKWAKAEHSQNSAVFFSGTHRWHYRDKIPAGTADVIMFHYNPV